ncbi:WD40 repeat-like protein [Gyrodon lividus]|nr:WD40 repeat-like protein [Gyrodon lividus]
MTTIGDATNPHPRVREQRGDESVAPLQPLHIMQGNTEAISRLAYIPESTLFVSGSLDSRCKVWSAKDGIEVGKEMVHSVGLRTFAVSRDGKTMVSGGVDGRIMLWTLESRTKTIEQEISKAMILSIAISQDSKRVVSGHHDGTIRILDVSTGDLIAGPYKLHDGSIHSVTFSPDGSQIATGGDDGHICVIHSHSGKAVTPVFKAHDQRIWSLVWPSSSRLISAARDTTIKYWDSYNGSLLASSHGHTEAVYALAISSDGKLLASASGDGTTRLWDTSTHEQIGSSLQHPTRLYSVALSSDAHYLAAAGYDRNVYIWNLKDIHELAKIVAENTIIPVPETEQHSSSGGAVSGKDKNVYARPLQKLRCSQFF